jgi:hypothetical protein
MKINISFLNGSPYWQDLVTKNAGIASSILSSADFLAKVAAFPKFDNTDETPGMVALKLQTTLEVNINVGFYWNWFSRAIAYEEDGSVYFNTAKESRGAGSAGNIAHECMHALGYEHNGNYSAGNLFTVPYWIGDQVDEIANA